MATDMPPDFACVMRTVNIVYIILLLNNIFFFN